MLNLAKRALSGVPAPAGAAASAVAPAASAGPLAVPVWARVPSAAVAAERGLKGACARACVPPRSASPLGAPPSLRVGWRRGSFSPARGHLLFPATLSPPQ